MNYTETLRALRHENTRASRLAFRSLATCERNAIEAYALACEHGMSRASRLALQRAERARARLERLEREHFSDAIAWAVENACDSITSRRMEIAFRKAGIQ